MSKSKKFIIVMSVSILSFNGIDAMDMVLALPYKSVNVIYNFFQKKTVIEQTYFDLLPKEIQGKVVKNIFQFSIMKQAPEKYINQEALEKYPLKIPMILSLNYINEFLEMEKICQKEIGGKKISAEQLFMLPKEEQDVFRRMANCPFLETGLGIGNIDSKDYKIIENMLQKNIVKGLCLEIRPSNKMFSTVKGAHKIALSSVLMATGSMVTMFSIVTFLPEFYASQLLNVSVFVFIGSLSITAISMIIEDVITNTGKLECKKIKL